MASYYFWLPHYPEWITGGLKYQVKLFEYFKKNSDNVFIFGNSPVERKFEKNKLFRIISGLVNVLRIPRKAIIVLTNAPFLDYSVPLLLNKLWKRHTYALIVHHLVHSENPTYMRKLLEANFIKHADMVIPVSETSKKELRRIVSVPESVPVVNPGLDIDPDFIRLKRELTKKVKILYVGSIEKRKGLITLIKALDYITGKDYELHVLGFEKSREYLEKIKSLIDELDLNDKIFFHGMVDSRTLKQYYLSSTVFVFPSFWEGYGMALAEAMAYGLPVIASRIPTSEELIDDEKDGVLFEPGDPVDLAEKLNKVLGDRVYFDNLSHNATEKSRTFPSWEETCRKIYDFIANEPLLE